MLENAWYSVISTEGCASILWRSADGKEEAAEALKLTAPSLLKFGIVDDVIAEPVGGAHSDPANAIEAVADYIDKCLTELSALSNEQLLSRRDNKFRHITRRHAALSAEVGAQAADNVDAPRKSAEKSDFSPTPDESSRN